MRVGSLFAGYGGIDLGLAMVLDAEPAWFCEFDKHPSAILAHRFPGVVNLGDIATVDWSTVEPVDVLTGGFPCQDVSHAGNRAGIKPGTRSGLWSHMAHAIAVLKPRLVVIENVAGLLSADAAGDVEPCPWCLGDESGSHLRALGAVLADLAEIGFDAEWASVRASDAGAPHRRERVFIVAAPHARGEAFGQWTGLRQGQSPGVRWGRLDDDGPQALLPTPTVNDGDKGGPNQTNGRGVRDSLPGVVPWLVSDGEFVTNLSSGEVDYLLPTPKATNNENRQSLDRYGMNLGQALGVTPLLPTPTSRDWKDGAPNDNVPTNALLGRAVWHDFGPYAPAIARWSDVLGRPAPSPTEPNKDGRPRLSPRFVEFMMGLPEGWVTDTGIPRNAQLKALGNGVVPQQLALALSILLPRLEQP